jgi:hypothetical protein
MSQSGEGRRHPRRSGCTCTEGRPAVGQHSAGKPVLSGTRPGDVLRHWSSARQSWAARHKVLLILGSTIAAALVIIVVASAVHGGGRAGNRPALADSPVGTASPSAHTPTRNAQAFAASLARLPANTELTGSAAIAWADAALAALGAPTTAANVQTMVDWFANEGTPHNLNNPLNLQTPFGGSTVSTADGDPPSDRIQAYPKPAAFVAAFPLEMHNGSYPAIVAALKAGKGLEGSAATPEIASELWVYSGDGYNSIPAS